MPLEAGKPSGEHLVAVGEKLPTDYSVKAEVAA